ncbi:EF-hand domain-containing protein [Sphingomonas sp. AX6]|uniref:EF-hand domain-containing protein n=1 Tax=Sphingomonas sp. AX6 TaxID=2653171 RepID=UPI0012F2595D|nr:EF-hand domain-containing protein [Sphingomonas sp. AX6]VXC95345.1 conserved hypothetical protein [Sphingomonas sp. AX6]
MLRFFAGVVSALLLVTAGLVVYRGWAADDPIIAAAPPPRLAPEQPVQYGVLEEIAVPKAPAKTREERRFDRYDKDRNDAITREEYLASRRKAFAKLDTNGNGRLDFEEWATRTTTKFASADADRSGAMSRAEFATTAVKRRAPVKTRCICPTPGEDAEE